MTAVASPPSFANINRPAWGLNGSSPLHAMNPEDTRGVFTPRKALQRTNSASSVLSTSSTSSTGTVVNGHTNGASSNGEVNGWRKRVQPKGQWSQQPQPVKSEGIDFSRGPLNRAAPNAVNGNGTMHQGSMMVGAQNQASQQGLMSRPNGENLPPNLPVLYLLSLNGTFERKTISVPFSPDTLRIGRQTNARTVPSPSNGYFDSKVLSRQHAEIWADRSGKIYIRDVKSSNGTFVNGTRLSPENRDSEPHELQTSDHLELGIDIVNEDQKSVVHHKVAAKVEHAGFLNPSHALMDMSFGDLDPSGGQMMMMMQQMGGIPQRGRTANQSAATNGRAAPAAGIVTGQSNGMMQRPGFWMGHPPMEAICSKIDQEKRLARLQLNDLKRTAEFLEALAGKDDVRLFDNSHSVDPKHQAVNGGLVRPENGKAARFSDPPAPPPQQPLPEKPDAVRSNGEAPPLKRGTTERPKLQPNSTSPIRQDSLNQIITLTETLNSAKKEIEGQSARIRDLEELVLKEREQRQSAEVLVRKLEDAAVVGSRTANVPFKVEGSQQTLLAEAFDLSVESPGAAAQGTTSENEAQVSKSKPESSPGSSGAADAAAADAAARLQDRMDEILKEMLQLREEVELQRRRAEKAEAERDVDRQTLSDMVNKIRERDEQIARLASERSMGSRSGVRNRGRTDQQNSSSENYLKPGIGSYPETPVTAVTPGGSLQDVEEPGSLGARRGSSDDGILGDASEGKPTLSRANTIKPMGKSAVHSLSGSNDPAMLQAAPYASMIGVVLIGMGLMAWINGWQGQPRLDR